MIQYFGKHPTAANIVTIVIVFIGCFFLPQLRRETFPDFESEIVQVTIVYPGASALEVEANVINVVEDALRNVSYIKKTQAEAHEGVAKIFITMHESGNIDKFIADIRNTVEGIRNFPQEAEKPVTTQFGIHLPVASIAITGDMSLEELKNFCEDIERQLRLLPQISQVELEGFSERIISIEVSQEKLLQYNLNISQIAQAISAQSVDLPSGKIETQSQQILIRYSDESKNIQDFEDIIIVTGTSGEEIPLGDIASVRSSFKLEEEKIIFGGQRAGLVTIYKAKDEDSLKILDVVRSYIDIKNENLPLGARLTLTQDVSSVVRDRLLLLLKNGWQGLLLVFLSMWIFFNFSLAFWVGMGLPVSFLVTCSIMNHMDYSLNMMTMLALLIALGLIMDDAIVIAENIAAHLQKGKTVLSAVIDGVNEVKMGVISSFLTTAFVFVPLAFMDGNLGKVLQVIPVVLIIVLIVSILEAFFILPSHLIHSMNINNDNPLWIRVKLEQFIDFIRTRLLKKVVAIAIRYRYLTLGILTGSACLAIAVLTSGIIKFRAFPDLEGNIVEARILLPQGTSLRNTEKIVDHISQSFAAVRKELLLQEGKDIVRSERITFNLNLDAKEQGSHVATISVDLIKSEYRNVLSTEIIHMWREKVGNLPDVISLKFVQRVLKPAGVPIEVLVQGEDLQQLKEASLAIQDKFNGIDGVYNISDDLRVGKPELVIYLKAGATELGVNSRDIAQQIRHSFHGNIVQEIQIGKESYEVEVKLAGLDRNQIEHLENFKVTTKSGTKVPLNVVANMEMTSGYSVVKHVKEVRTVTIQGDIDYKKVNLQEIMTQMQTIWIPDFEKQFPQVSVVIEGETENSAVTTSSIWRSLIIGVIGIFVLLSFQFKSYGEPIIIMTAIPFSFIGVIVGHFIMDMELSLPGLLGFASLAGIVVNDSILLVEFIKKRQEQGENLALAATEASGERFRAVFLTSLTTMAGLFPLLLEKSVQAQVLIPIATSLVFGLLFSTILVLVILPCMYAIINDFKTRN